MYKVLAMRPSIELDPTKLDLSERDISNECVFSIARWLKTDRTLRELNLYFNQIEKGGAIALAKALKSNDSLRELNLNYNHIGEEGAIALAEALRSNNSLRILRLDYNGIGKKGARALAEALVVNHMLTELELDYDNITSSQRPSNEVVCALSMRLEFNVRKASHFDRQFIKDDWEIIDSPCNAFIKDDWEIIDQLPEGPETAGPAAEPEAGPAESAIKK